MLDSIISMINNRNINNANIANRGILEYRPSEIGGFITPYYNIDNIIITGGDRGIRANAITAIAYNSCVNHIPVIVLHESDIELENRLKLTFENTGYLTVINPGNAFYDPFFELGKTEICKLIIESIPKDYDLKPNARNYIDGMISYLEALHKKPSLPMMAKCPHVELFNLIDRIISNNKITQEQGNIIKNKLMQGQSEAYKIENYLELLYSHFSSISCNAKNNNVVNLPKAVSDKDILSIDIVSNMNETIVTTIANQIKTLIAKGETITLIIDDISFTNNKVLSELLLGFNSKCKLTISSNDVYALCNADDKNFNTLFGRCHTAVVYSHSSGTSASKISEIIGYYEKTEITQSRSTGSSRSSPFQLFSGSNSTSTTNYNLKREYIVKPEEITRMGRNEVYIVNRDSGELSHTSLID